MSSTSLELGLDGPKDGKWTSAMTWLDDRLNPVLVKEVRQALRGKQFRSAFLFTVIMSLIVAVSIVLTNSGTAEWSPIGPPFFKGVFICLTIAVIGFVPMATFTAMGAEWEENTYDLLILSHLRPRHIVIGKLLGAGAQALLYFSVFTPYVVFTFLLGGVDLKLVMVSLPMLAVVSLALSALAAGLSSLTDKRMGRAGLMVLLSAALVGACIAVISLTIASLEMGIDFAADEVRFSITGILLLALILGGYSVAIAIARLSHPEENRSSGLRVLTSLFVFTALGWIAWMNTYISQPDFVAAMTIVLIVMVTLVSIFFVTEREALGLRVKNHLPQGGLLRFVVFPWLPGGARGTVWLLGTLGVIVIVANQLILTSTHSSFLGGIVAVSTSGLQSIDSVLAIAGYSVIYLLLPSALFTNRTGGLQRSTLARVMIPAFFLGGILLPMLAGFALGDSSLLQGRHIGNPIHRIERIIGGSESAGAVLLLAGIILVLQSFRVYRSIMEVKRAPRPGALAAVGSGVALERVPDADDDLDSNA